MNTQEIADRVKAQFGDTAGAQITNTDILRWINDSQREIVIDSELLQVKANATITSGISDYNLDSLNSLKIIAVKIKNIAGQAIMLQPVSVRDAVKMFETDSSSPPVGTSSHYSFSQKTITLYPRPDTSISGGLVIYFSRRPVELTAISSTNTVGVDLSELPIEYHNRIVEYCIAQAAELDDDLNLAALKMGQFQSGIDKLKGSEDQPQDYYPTISVGWDDYG